MAAKVVKRRGASSAKGPKASRPQMPGYGIPPNQEGLLPWRWAEQRLKKSHNYFISTSRPDGTPHMMVIWGLWLDGVFLFSTGASSRKAANLRKTPTCVVATENAAEAVIVEGTAELSQDATLLKNFAKQYKKKYDWDMSDSSEPVYVLRPQVAFGLYEKNFTGSATRWQFSNKV
jgi:general stress protein 26